jgi:hypothetical protein
VALFPQFVRPGEPVLPLALGMAGAIVLFDLAWSPLLRSPSTAHERSSAFTYNAGWSG